MALQSILPIPFGKYILVGKLGNGAMGEVFLSVVDHPGRARQLVVIKRSTRVSQNLPG